MYEEKSNIMKIKFPEYYKPTEKEFEYLWENCIFVFDTSVLINIYEFSPKARDTFLGILKKISDRVWIPNQVAKEYLSRRQFLIREQKEIHQKIQEKFKETKDSLIQEIEKTVIFHPYIDKNELNEKIKKYFRYLNSYLRKCEENYPDLVKKDSIGEKIDSLFNGKVGDECAIEELKQLYKEGAERYSQKIPPGFANQQTKDNIKQYGDFIIWHQIIQYAKIKNKPVIFVIDDVKNDWWLIHNYQKSNKEILSPRPELIKEFFLKTNNSFFMYNSENFMESYRKYLKEDVSNETIKEVRDLRTKQSGSEKLFIFDSKISKNWNDLPEWIRIESKNS